MYFFRNDYSEGALPQVLDALNKTNALATVGYGLDPFCEDAACAIRERFACPNADVHFFVGGTQVNLTALSAFLRPWEAAAAASSGHIAVHETGSIEATGHKVCTVPSRDGKLTPEQIRAVCLSHVDEHMVRPELVYISDSTELGTVYSRCELEALSETCREMGLTLYLDGARLASALAASDLSPEDLPKLCDAFYIGGTKNGLLFGEALVVVRDEWKPDFRYAIKQRGAMLAKGRLLGVQFQALMKDDLWLKSAAHANAMAARLRDGLNALHIPMEADSPTNQLFPILPNSKVETLSRSFSFETWGTPGPEHTTVRFVTSWATTDDAVDALLDALRA